jgi:hypothetical protein
MYPKAYIFTIDTQPHILASLKTKYSANVTITSYSTYLKHHPDVDQMIKVAHYQQPRPAFTDVITIPNVNKSQLLAELMKKQDEAFYILDKEDDLETLRNIADAIDTFGPDLRRISDSASNMFHSLFHHEGSNPALHDRQHEMIYEKFVKPMSST